MVAIVCLFSLVYSFIWLGKLDPFKGIAKKFTIVSLSSLYKKFSIFPNLFG
jgi:hypothetical protein